VSTTAAPARPTSARSAVQMPSQTVEGVTYTTSATSCSCPSFTFRHVNHPEFQCKHQVKLAAQVAAYRAIKRCSMCHVTEVADYQVNCDGCNSLVRVAMTPIHLVRVAMTPIHLVRDEANCLMCGRRLADDCAAKFCTSCAPKGTSALAEPTYYMEPSYLRMRARLFG
jgi:hypothetical protein